MAVFVRGGEKYDQEQYWGRVRKFVDMVDPRTLLPGPLLGLSREKALETLAQYDQRGSGWNNISEEKLWLAQKIVSSTHHPDTGEVIPAPFRMSGFAPFGTPIVVGMLVAQTPAQNAFWQWANQSHNAAVNFCNRNASSEPDVSETALSYAVAVTSAVSVCLGADRLLQRMRAPALARFVPFVAVASANLINISLMRRRELKDGIAVFDAAGARLGNSIVAARKALQETAVSRVVLPAPILLLSPLVMMSLEKVLPVIRTNAALRVPVQASVVSLTFLAGLPLSLALFKDRGELALASLEPEIAAAATSPFVYYNKGL